MNNILIYLRLLAKELISPLNYVLALIIGVIINYFQGIGIFSSLVPFIVPIVVQSISKASVKFNNRHVNMLVRLPIEKKDPAFVINVKGNIIASEGKTKSVFNKHNIHTIFDLFENDKIDSIKIIINDCCKTNNHTSYELYSPSLNGWYTVNVKSDTQSNNILVWLTDISLRKKLDLNLQKIRNFNTQLMLSIDKQLKQNDTYDHLAKFILEQEYAGVFIVNKDLEGNLKGYVYKSASNNIKKSDEIIISKNTDAPIWKSRKDLGIVTDSISNYNDQNLFYTNNRFNPRVTEFLNFKILNFINYHEEDISVITFNKQSEVTQQDLTIMEGIVNSVFTINYLVNIIKNCK